MDAKDVYQKEKEVSNQEYIIAVEGIKALLKEREMKGGFIKVYDVTPFVNLVTKHVNLLERFNDYIIKGSDKQEEPEHSVDISNFTPEIKEVPKEEKPKVDWDSETMMPKIREVIEKSKMFGKSFAKMQVKSYMIRNLHLENIDIPEIDEILAEIPYKPAKVALKEKLEREQNQMGKKPKEKDNEGVMSE